MNSLIKDVNKRLVKYFGIPKRPQVLPDPLDMLVATILSQNTNDQNSFKAYSNLKKRFPKWEDVHKARRTSIEKEIKIAGLGFQKSTAIKELLKQLKNETGNLNLKFILNLSNDEAINYLTSLKGIGVKTASCVLLFSLDKNICPVDTHLHRTLNRIGIVDAKTAEKTFSQVNEDFPKKIAHQFHTNLIRLGREICKPKNPLCLICPVESVCNYKDKNYENQGNKVEKSFMLLDNI